ncbi:hypothetical protein KKH23_08595 [Patescibacteria group bacterium]|nr:hypothetical protein [Patescibacteria group bacterium]
MADNATRQEAYRTYRESMAQAEKDWLAVESKAVEAWNQAGDTEEARDAFTTAVLVALKEYEKARARVEETYRKAIGQELDESGWPK